MMLSHRVSEGQEPESCQEPASWFCLRVSHEVIPCWPSSSLKAGPGLEDPPPRWLPRMAAGKISWFLTTWAFPSGCSWHGIWLPPKLVTQERKRECKQEATVPFMTFSLTHTHFCLILFVRSKSLSPPGRIMKHSSNNMHAHFKNHSFLRPHLHIVKLTLFRCAFYKF